ncbi:uncharacterized protein LOC132798960 isoform X2 [Drosophila nasuta]|uniref:uncharacterized protein LOC132798960 isoform X2 n=1 Tax=Drosophila nasuta TaxID=42062 RepID=UPI00295E6B2F|nr:uncharacterized protein LOC132798960 isoform X2 [Drosophila nasuta]
MIFDTFLNRFELRTGCFVVTITNMIFVIFSLHVPMVADFDMSNWIAILAAIERLFEFFSFLFVSYGLYQRSRQMLLIWQILIPLSFIFNVGYYFYLSAVLNSLKWLILLVLSLYLITYSLMLINSYYDELGYVEDYMRDLEYIQSRNLQKNPHSYNPSMKSEDRVVKITRHTATYCKATVATGNGQRAALLLCCR